MHLQPDYLMLLLSICNMQRSATAAVDNCHLLSLLANTLDLFWEIARWRSYIGLNVERTLPCCTVTVIETNSALQGIVWLEITLSLYDFPMEHDPLFLKLANSHLLSRKSNLLRHLTLPSLRELEFPPNTLPPPPFDNSENMSCL
jgi:hypothetical protein